MKKKFNPKVYLGRPRVYTPVAPSVQRLWVWNEARSEYSPPTRGDAYEARRAETGPDGIRRRVKQSFASLEEARNWQARLENRSEVSVLDVPRAPQTMDQPPGEPEFEGMTFGDVVARWKQRMYPGYALSTQIAYDKIVNLYFGPLILEPMKRMTPDRLDRWIDYLKDPSGKFMQSTRRQTFTHELALLGTIFGYYIEYHDDPVFRHPIKQRHWDAVILNRPKPPKMKDVREEEFDQFLEKLAQHRRGKLFVALASLQYGHALRVSEAAGLYWEDIQFNWTTPKLSRIRFVRSLVWPRKLGVPSFVQTGFKNSRANDGVKDQPMHPRAFHALKSLYKPGATGLVFSIEGEHLEYRQIQWAYNNAFSAAGLPYTATHVMRHGRTRAVYDANPNPELAKQVLGNTTLQSALVYAVRRNDALTEFVQKEWDSYEAGRNWSQIATPKSKVVRMKGI